MPCLPSVLHYTTQHINLCLFHSFKYLCFDSTFNCLMFILYIYREGRSTVGPAALLPSITEQVSTHKVTLSLAYKRAGSSTCAWEVRWKQCSRWVTTKSSREQEILLMSYICQPSGPFALYKHPSFPFKTSSLGSLNPLS